MLAVFAEFERDILRERVRAGIAQAGRVRMKPIAGGPIVADEY
jgi:DNA invertase Pin-like site-specific DNA recombinase